MCVYVHLLYTIYILYIQYIYINPIKTILYCSRDISYINTCLPKNNLIFLINIT